MLHFVEFKNDLMIPDDTYKKVLEHLDVMNNWKFNPELLKKYPSLAKDFTFQEAFIDLLGKGCIRYYE